ncbi:hypothetical protein V1509DRAFT_515976 [Lipomyces kononenkoae]
MNSILAILFRQRNGGSGASLKSNILEHTDEKATFAALDDNVTVTNHETPKKTDRQDSESVLTVFRARPSTNRRVSTMEKGGLIIESRAKQDTSAVREVNGTMAAAGPFTRLLQHKDKGPSSQPKEHRMGKKISIRIYRVTDEYIPKCQNLVDRVFINDSLCQYLRGLTIADRKSSAITKRYYKMSRQLDMRRAAVKGDISLRAALVSSDIVAGTFAPLEVLKEAEACAGFALWRLSPQSAYSWRLFLFDLRTARRRLVATLDEIYCALKTGNFYYSEYHIPGGVVDENRYTSYMRSREKIVRRVLNGRRYLTIKNLGVLEEFRNVGIGSELLQYGLDMADTQNLPIYIETSSLKFVKFCEKFQFKLVHELRLLDIQQSVFNIRNREMRSKPDTEAGPSSKESEEKFCQDSPPTRTTCAVYCLIREPAVKKLTPLPVLQSSRVREPSDAKIEKC